MSKFLPALTLLRELRLKTCAMEMDESMVQLFDEPRYGRKKWMASNHAKYHRKPVAAAGYFYARLFTSTLFPRLGQKLKNAYTQSKLFLEAWMTLKMDEGNETEQFWAGQCYKLVVLFHKAFQNTRRSHKFVKSFGFLGQLRRQRLLWRMRNRSRLLSWLESRFAQQAQK